MVVVFEEAGAAGSSGPEPKSRLLIPGFQLFCAAALSFSSTTTMLDYSIFVEVCADPQLGQPGCNGISRLCHHAFISFQSIHNE